MPEKKWFLAELYQKLQEKRVGCLGIGRMLGQFA
jgi:hypothetical protein